MTENWRSRIIDAMKRDGRGVRQLARDTGLSSTFISDLKKLNKEPGVERLMVLMRELKLSVTWTLTGIELSQEVEDFAQLMALVPEEEKGPLLDLLRARTSSSQK